MSLLKKFTLQRKASRVGDIITGPLKDLPLWTPKSYTDLAEEGYHNNVIVYRCVTLIARNLASIPWIAYRKNHQLPQSHPLLMLLNRPSPRQAGSAFMEEVVSYLLLAGNSYIEAVGPGSAPAELYALRPDRMRVVPGPGGVPKAFEYSVNGRKQVLNVDPSTGASGILHLKLFNPLNDWYGMSPIEAASRSIDQHNAVATHNLSLLRHGGRPSGALVLKEPLGTIAPETRKKFVQELSQLYAGTTNAGRLMLLDGNFEWKEMNISPKDMDFNAGKAIAAREIAQAFGVPPMLVGVPGDATFANFREARFHLWEDTVLPLLEFIVAELNLWLAPRFGKDIVLRYDTDNVPALAPRREAAWNRIAAADFLTLSEKRTALGFPPLPSNEVPHDVSH